MHLYTQSRHLILAGALRSSQSRSVEHKVQDFMTLGFENFGRMHLFVVYEAAGELELS